jgi:hypothetical protein
VILPALVFAAALQAPAPAAKPSVTPPTAAPADPQPQRQGPAPFVARFALEPARARIGDRLTLTIDIDASTTIESVQPRLAERLGDFDVLSIDSTPVTRDETGWRQQWRVTLAVFDKGEPRLPRFALDYSAAGGLMQAYWVDAGLVATITAPVVTADMPLRPIVARADPPPASPWPRIALIGGVLSVIIGVLSVPAILWWSRALARRRLLAFFRDLQRELAKLGEAPTETPAAARDAYTRAAEILRLGVGRVAPGDTSSLPSPDLAAHLARTGADGARLAGRLRTALAAVDAVRFGNQAPTPPRHSATLGEAGGLVQSMAATAVASTPRSRRAKAS